MTNETEVVRFSAQTLRQTADAVDAAMDVVERAALDQAAVISAQEALIAELRERIASEQFVLSLRPSNIPPGWKFDPSDTRNTIVVEGDKIHGRITGLLGDNSTFARMRAFLPEYYDIAPRKSFQLRGRFAPRQPITKYVRFLGTDNYKAVMKTSAETVGCGTGDEWRVMFGCYSDGLPRLLSHHQDHGAPIELYKGSQPLSVGMHTVEIDFDPKKDATGSFAIRLDGVQVASRSNLVTVPSTVPNEQVVVTRLVACIDGANEWVGKTLDVDLYEVDFAAEL